MITKGEEITQENPCLANMSFVPRSHFEKIKKRIVWWSKFDPETHIVEGKN